MLTPEDLQNFLTKFETLMDKVLKRAKGDTEPGATGDFSKIKPATDATDPAQAPLPKFEISPEALEGISKAVQGGVLAGMMGLDLKTLNPAALTKAMATFSQRFAFTGPQTKGLDNFQELLGATSRASGLARVSIQELIKSTKPIEKIISPLNISLEQVGKAKEEMSGLGGVFSELQTRGDGASKKLTTRMAALATVLNKTTNMSIGNFNKQFTDFVALHARGDTSTKALSETFNKFANRALSAGRSLGINFASAADLVSNKYPQLIGLGNTYNMNLDTLASAAQRAKVDMQSFIDVSGQFDTIEGAASVVGDLNAVLRGTNLSINEMVAADPADRVKAVLGEIQTAVSEGRVTVAEGGQQRRFMIQTLADAARISMADMEKLMSKQMSVDEMFKNRVKETKGGMEEVAAVGKKNLPIADKLAVPLTTAANKLPLVTGAFKTFITGLDENIPVLTKRIADLTTSIGGTTAAVHAILRLREIFQKEGGEKADGILGQVMFGQGDVISTQAKILNDALTNLAKVTTQSMKNLGEQMDNVREKQETVKNNTPVEPIPINTKVDKVKKVIRFEVEPLQIKDIFSAATLPE